MPQHIAVTGVGGFVAPRHRRAIGDTGNRLVPAVDPKDSVGVLDPFSFDVRFLTELERFDRHVEKLRRGPEEARVPPALVGVRTTAPSSPSASPAHPMVGAFGTSGRGGCAR